MKRMLWRNGQEQRVRTRTMKIADMRAPRIRAPPWHGGQFRVFLKMLPVVDPPRGRPFGSGGVHRKYLRE